MPARLSWFEGYSDSQQSVEVRSTAEVDDALDQLTTRARASGVPFNVELDRHDGTHMSMVVGAPETFVEWGRLEPWASQASTSDRAVDETDLVAFAGNGQYSEIPRYLWIDLELGRSAIWHYFQTGTLIQTVRWSEI